MRVKAESLSNKAVGSAHYKKHYSAAEDFPANVYTPPPPRLPSPTPLIDISLVTDSHLCRLIWPSRGSAPTFLLLIGLAQEGGSEREKPDAV